MKLNQQLKTTMSLAAAMGALALTATSANAALTVTSYTYDAAGVPIGGGQAPLLDAGNLKLTDGVYPISGWNNGEHVGWRDGTAAQKLVGKPLVTFDLGGQFDLTTIDVWAPSQFADPTQTLTILSSTDGSTWNPTTVVDPLNWVTVTPALSVKVTIDVSSLPTGQFYQMKFDESGDWLMLTEVDFEGSAVPEPSTTALLGLGGLALILRRRK